jgi:hypothetical protein
VLVKHIILLSFITVVIIGSGKEAPGQPHQKECRNIKDYPTVEIIQTNNNRNRMNIITNGLILSNHDSILVLLRI